MINPRTDAEPEASPNASKAPWECPTRTVPGRSCEVDRESASRPRPTCGALTSPKDLSPATTGSQSWGVSAQTVQANDLRTRHPPNLGVTSRGRRERSRCAGDKPSSRRAPVPATGERTSRSGRCRLTTAEVVGKAQVLEAFEDNANLVLDLSSSPSEPLRVTVRLNDEIALDVRTPAVSAQCSHSPVYSHKYRLPGDTARVTIVTDQGQRRSTSSSHHGLRTCLSANPLRHVEQRSTCR